MRHSLILAHHFSDEVQKTGTKRYELAQRFHLSPSRISQISRLCVLSPVIQEDILINDPPIATACIIDILKQCEWEKQEAMWKALKQEKQV